MPLDPSDPIAPLESATIRAALGVIVTSACSILATVGVSAESVDEFDRYASATISVAGNIITIYFAYKAIRARIAATETIRKGNPP